MFIVLQLVGLGVVGYFPQLVNYLPLRSYYSSEVSPPPINPKLQECLIDYSYNKYEENFSESILITNDLITTNIDFLPEKQNKNFIEKVKKSAFSSQANEIVDDDFKLDKNQTISIIPPIGGG